MKFHLRAVTLSLALLGAAALPARASSSTQLVLTEAGQTLLNGQAVQFYRAPVLSSGLTLVPVRETATLLGAPTTLQNGALLTGRLSVNAATGVILLDGQPVDSPLHIDTTGEPFIDAQILAQALGAAFSRAGDVATLTLLRDDPARPDTPQARFVTDKATYAPGERISYVDYSFDPDGTNLTRTWTGAQDAFYQPGTYPVTLQVTNTKGLRSAPLTRTVRVQGPAVDTPLSYALRHTPVGETITDRSVLTYPAAPTHISSAAMPLLFSDSPEAPTRPGVLYRDTLDSGPARLMAYHLNKTARPARLFILARPAAGQTSAAQVIRSGAAAPTRLEGTLGQVSVLDFLSSPPGAAYTLTGSAPVALYASPVLQPGQGAKVLMDVQTTGATEYSVVLLEDGAPLTADTLSALPVLPPDAQHVRGTFPGAVRRVNVQLSALPARVTLGDGQRDPALTGVDATTGREQRLGGNYGVQYDLRVENAAGTVAAFVPRGGPYRGAAALMDGTVTQFLKLPGNGTLTDPDAPLLLRRVNSGTLNLSFIPAGGSNLPVALIFYPQPPALPR
ncbi:hypothetical protein [Deinococcus soli (ex Cha et al. 2016)]|uniref:PKD repeat protein n=2 Tax=Deinococcus soli (ex Cha et al. 2016) TaxID=1309411 RepID=A0AAE3XCE2_9DEIO|nr:hypothetical protein [Deinococcus soli (ex Cha et al. 2016)]MDR6218726.1 PKD repeat protein [Deinococcus soli (ex Cha et al. 2016)]MDR6328523.1 PKD repeat protein [Deinococcus soli (ex Cha et al. 2016)]MDR6753134.1 PKD repeat protein [Deinococcus soli (ex Cha et al. 2016)]